MFMKRNQITRFLFALLFIVFTLFMSMGVSVAQAATASRATATPGKATPLPGHSQLAVRAPACQNAVQEELLGMAAITSNNAWTVGDCINKKSVERTLVEHWDGTLWKVVASPNVGSSKNVLSSVAAVTSTNVWAVGSYDNNNIDYTLTEHWNGSKWKVVASPNVGSSKNVLSSVAVVSSTDIWAVGYYDNNGINDTLTEHWNGTSWSVVTSPSPGSFANYLRGVAVTSSTDIWAVGYYANYNGYYYTLVQHWDGTQWSVVSSPNPGATDNDYLIGVAVVSSTDVWAVGDYLGNGDYNITLTEHWDGTSWSVVTSPGSSVSYFLGVAVISTTDVWAVGYYSNNGIDQTLTAHWDGTSWSVVASPNPSSTINVLSSVAVISTTDVWAVGYYSNTNQVPQTLIEHWDGTSWSVIPSP